MKFICGVSEPRRKALLSGSLSKKPCKLEFDVLEDLLRHVYVFHYHFSGKESALHGQR